MSEAYTVKALEWVRKDYRGRETHISSPTTLYELSVQKLWNGRWRWFCRENGETHCDSLEDGKAEAEAWYLSRLMPALVPLAPAAKPAAPDAANVGELREAWRSQDQHDKRLNLVANLNLVMNQIATSEPCKHCDPDVGHECEFCFTYRIASEAAHYINRIDSALLASPAPRPDAAAPSAADAGVVGRLVEALRAVEWGTTISVSIGTVPACPACLGWNPEAASHYTGPKWRLGHKPHCVLALALAAAPDAKAGTGEGGNATTAPDGAGLEGGK